MNFFKKILSKETSFFMSLPAFLWQILFLYGPVVVLIFLSFFARVEGDCLPAFTLKYYKIIFTNNAYILIILRSFTLASITALLCVVTAYPIAYFVSIKAKKYKSILIFLLTLPFWTNFLVQVYAWYFILEKNGLLNDLLIKLGLISSPLRMLNNSFAVYLVMFYCFLPFAVLPIYSILEKFDESLIEVSLDLGAGYWKTFYKVIFPLTLSGIRNGFLFVFIPAFGDFAIPVLLSGNKKFYVGSLATNLFLVSKNTRLAASFAVFSSFFLLIASMIFFVMLNGKFKDEEEQGAKSWRF